MKPAFEIKSARTDALAVYLHNADAAALDAALAKCAAQYRELNLPLILDMQDFRPSETDLPAVLAVFRRHRLPVAALRHSDEAWAATAAANGLPFTPPGKERPVPLETADAGTVAQITGEIASETAKQTGHPTVLVAEPVRTGQQVYAENADLIVTGTGIDRGHLPQLRAAVARTFISETGTDTPAGRPFGHCGHRGLAGCRIIRTLNILH